MNAKLVRKNLRLQTLRSALLKFCFSLLFFAGAAVLWLLLWLAVWVLLVQLRGRSHFPGSMSGHLRWLTPGTPEYYWLALAVAGSIFGFGFIGLFFRWFRMDTEVATLHEEPGNPLGQLCLLPGFLAASGMRHFLQALLLLVVSHRELTVILLRMQRARLYVSDLKAMYPRTYRWYETALLALPGFQLLNPEAPYFLLTSRGRENIFRQPDWGAD